MQLSVEEFHAWFLTTNDNEHMGIEGKEGGKEGEREERESK